MNWRVLAKRLAVDLFLIFAVISFAGGLRLAGTTFHPVVRELPEETADHPESAFDSSTVAREVRRRTQDGVLLGAWYVRPSAENGDAVVILHGLSDNRLASAGLAPMFLRRGYRVLLPDSRAHGESGGVATFGLHEANDVHDWVSWLYKNDPPRCVYGFGQSMGAAIVLQSLAKESRFCAAVSDSAFATFREAAYEHVGEFVGMGPHWFGQTLGRPMIWIGILYGRLRYHENLMEANPQTTLVATTVPVLLIHGVADEDLLPANSVVLHNAAPSHTELWLVPGAGHIGAYSTHPQEFEQRILDWFAAHSRT